jgi:chromosome segregation ATPase
MLTIVFCLFFRVRSAHAQLADQSDISANSISSLEDQVAVLQARANTAPPSPGLGEDEGGEEDRVLRALQTGRLQLEDVKTQLAREKDDAVRKEQKLRDEVHALKEEVDRLSELATAEQGKVAAAETRIRSAEDLLDTERAEQYVRILQTVL